MAHRSIVFPQFSERAVAFTRLSSSASQTGAGLRVGGHLLLLGRADGWVACRKRGRDPCQLFLFYNIIRLYYVFLYNLTRRENLACLSAGRGIKFSMRGKEKGRGRGKRGKRRAAIGAFRRLSWRGLPPAGSTIAAAARAVQGRRGQGGSP